MQTLNPETGSSYLKRIIKLFIGLDFLKDSRDKRTPTKTGSVSLKIIITLSTGLVKKQRLAGIEELRERQRRGQGDMKRIITLFIGWDFLKDSRDRRIQRMPTPETGSQGYEKNYHAIYWKIFSRGQQG